MTNLQAYFATAAQLLGTEKIVQLMGEYGYNGTPSADILMEMAEKEGKEFLQMLGEEIQEALKTDEAKTLFLIAAQQANRISKATGKQANGTDTIVDTTTTTGSATQRSEQAMAWFDRIASLFGKGLDSVPAITGAIDGTNKTLAEAEYLRQLQLQEEQRNKKTLYWVLGGIGVLLIIVIFVIALSKRS